MNILRLFFLLAMLLSLNPLKASSPELSCPMPAPDWIDAPEITNNSIKIKWDNEGGAVWYKIERFDVTNGVPLADVFVAGANDTYTSTPHNPGTTVEFKVSATSCNSQADNAFGSPVTGEFTTSIIIVDDIVFLTAPGTPSGNVAVTPGVGDGNDEPIWLLNADKSDAEVRVTRAKVKYTTGGQEKYAEVMLWSQCNTVLESIVRVKHWGTSAGVTYSNLTQGGQIYAIRFFINNGAFFTLQTPSFGQEAAGIIVHNDRSSGTIYLDTSGGEGDNECYNQGLGVDGDGADEAQELVSDAAQVDRENIAETPVSTLTVSPNPFSDALRVQFNLDSDGPVDLMLLDLIGRPVQQWHMAKASKGNHQTYLNTDNLPAGTYMLTLQTNTGRTATTVLKH